MGGVSAAAGGFAAMTSFAEKWARARRAGLWATLRCRSDRIGLHVLRLIFGFDSWHASAPFSCRPYKGIVVGLANALQPSIVVEIGCGLGDIISRVAAIERFGIDADSKVIRAARFLHPGRGRWIHGDEYCIQEVVAPGRTIDCLIMVNWIHTLSPERLSELLLPVLPRTRYLILDAIDADGPPSYRYKHNFDFLAALTSRLSVARAPSEPRRFIVFEVTK
jgi:SAM-dependent methyltransferase